MKKIIYTKNAPEPVGSYSQAVQINNTLFISGQIAIDPKTKKISEGIKSQTKQVMENIAAILHEAGFQFSDVVKSTVLLNDINNFKAMNDIYATYYPHNPPARTAFEVNHLPLDVLVEIDTIAIK